MAVSVYNVKKWFKMFRGTSIYHVDQGIGKMFVPDILEGYFNDFTQKVIKGDKYLGRDGLPEFKTEKGDFVKMPTMIFQYGLGAYDLWLLGHDRECFNAALKCAKWALEKQQDNGAWSNFFYIFKDNPYSAMPQGEGASLLLRMYKETGDKIFYYGAKKAIDYMLTDVNAGGVTDYNNGNMVLLEYTHLPAVLNGWVFAAFGIYDMSIVNPEYKDRFNNTIESLKAALPNYDCGYWSKYDSSRKISSPFYHKLHIAQLQALYDATGDSLFLEYRNRFEIYEHNWMFRKRAFINKAIQKVLE